MKVLLAGLIGVAIGAAGAWYIQEKVNPITAYYVETSTGEKSETPPGTGKPAYLIVLGDVYDREAFMSGYAGKLGGLYEKYGGEYIAIGQNKNILENGKEFQSFVISKWPSMEAARSFWNDPEYVKLKDARIDNKWSQFDVYLLEGMPEATPSSSDAE